MMNLVDQNGGREQGRDAVCGVGSWEAAKDALTSLAGQKETGSVMGACGHQIIQTAVNMLRVGERFVFALLVERKLAKAKKVRCFMMDVICKLWPWRKKMMEELGWPDDHPLLPCLDVLMESFTPGHAR